MRSAIGSRAWRRPATSSDTRALERTAGAITELSQQLAATQAQVASLAAQLTTLAHRVTYDLERAGQTTVERVLRDLPTEVGAILGPAIDDLTDQVEADAARVTEAVERTLSTRLASVGEIVDGLPLANTELLNAVRSLEADLEDRFTGWPTDSATRSPPSRRPTPPSWPGSGTMSSTSPTPRAARPPTGRSPTGWRRRSTGSPRARSPATPPRPSRGSIAEHLEVLRDELETRLGTLAPTLQEELEAVRAETASGIDSAAEALVERLDALESALTSSVDAALAEQLEGIDALVTERVDHRAAATAAAGAEGAAEGDTAEAMAAVTEELKALRRRITLRLEGDAPTGLTPEQVEDLAAQVARRLGTDRPARRSGPRLSPDPVDAAGPTRDAPTRPTRPTRSSRPTRRDSRARPSRSSAPPERQAASAARSPVRVCGQVYRWLTVG